MKFIYILLLVVTVVVSEAKDSEKNDISPLTKEKVEVKFGLKKQNDTTFRTDLFVAQGTSLFDAMLHAQDTDGIFSFTYKMYKIGAYITSIFGIEEKPAPDYLYWMLYNCKHIVDSTQLNNLLGCKRSGTGVSQTYLQEGDIYVFHYQYYNWKENQH